MKIYYLHFTALTILGPLLILPEAKAQTKESTPFSNPIVWADVPDLSVTRSGEDFYLISTTMHLMPGAPVMHSKDLVHWETASYVFDSLIDTPKYSLKEGTVYGRGQWASSIRFHKGKYYVLFSPNDEPYKSYFYVTDNPQTGKWKLISRLQHFHDASLFFDDDDRAYVFTSNKVFELEKDLSDIKNAGKSIEIFKKDVTETGLLEGNQIIKHNGKYYLMMLSWPRDKNRRQVCYRADNITGPYEKKVVLEDNFLGFPYAGQGCLTDDKNGNWYAIIFQDRNGVGRVPLLIPTTWQDDWPVLGDNGKVPLHGEVPLKPFSPANHLVESDDFSGKKLKICWQWNHNPVNSSWSLTEKEGYLRLKTNRIVDNLYAAPNSLTQRMEGPECTGVVAFDVTKMKDGDVAGLSAFNGHSGILAVEMQGKDKYLTFSTNIVNLDDKTKAILSVQKEEKARIPLKTNTVYMRLDANFNLGKDIATFYYSTDNNNWTSIGPVYKMIFDYRKLFMGSKFAIFNYATKAIGGSVDVDFFQYKLKL